MIRELLTEIGERLRFLEDRRRQYDLRIKRLFRQDERCRRLAEVEGVGPLVATALVAAVGNAREFKSGSELTAYLGLVPRHRASGGRTVLLEISKRGGRVGEQKCASAMGAPHKSRDLLTDAVFRPHPPSGLRGWRVENGYYQPEVAQAVAKND